jgi:HSP20 family protein
MWKDPWKFSRGILEDIDTEFEEVANMLNRVFQTVREGGPSSIAHFPYCYGYQLRVGPDGKPKVREFGNVRPSVRGLIEQTGIGEPMVDTAINKKENTLTITAEMPGVTKQDIKVNVADGFVSIHAEQAEKKYHIDIPVNTQLDDGSAKATYSNGILELKIKLKEDPKLKGREVKVE